MVAVPAVLMMQMPTHQVVHVIAVRDLLVTTALAVRVVVRVSVALVPERAGHGVLRRRADQALDGGLTLNAVEMPIVQVVHVLSVGDGAVFATRTVPMRMLAVCV